MAKKKNPPEFWASIVRQLEQRLPEDEFASWIAPLQAELRGNDQLVLLAPNRFVSDRARDGYSDQITDHARRLTDHPQLQVTFELGGHAQSPRNPQAVPLDPPSVIRPARPASNLNPDFVFERFVEGRCNQIARAACLQVAQNPGTGHYNPLYIYGGTALGKTHLMQAVGNAILARDPQARVVYVHSERFFLDMVKALRTDTMDEFKRHYRSAHALLIDDVQFFAGKTGTQEEFFHTFNSLLEMQQQVVITCDRYPKEVEGLEDRLKSRFGWGLTVVVEPPELETRVAILQSKAQQLGVALDDEVAQLVAKRIRSNVRELEGALRRVIANAEFTGRAIPPDFAREALADLLALQDKLITVENIQKVVAEYYKLPVRELLSPSRRRSVARPRQIAMALAKELTNRSLPEIGDRFGGRDHTTVLHACRKVAELRQCDVAVQEDYGNLMRTLST